MARLGAAMQPLYTCTRPLCGPRNICRATRHPSSPCALPAAPPSTGTRSRLQTRSPECETHCRTLPIQGCSTSRQPSPSRPASARRRPLCGPVLATSPCRHPRDLPCSAPWSIVYMCTRRTTAMGRPICRRRGRRACRRECLDHCSAGGAGRHHHGGPRSRPCIKAPAIPAPGRACGCADLLVADRAHQGACNPRPWSGPCGSGRSVRHSPEPPTAKLLSRARHATRGAAFGSRASRATRPRAITQCPVLHSRRAPNIHSLPRVSALRKCGDRT